MAEKAEDRTRPITTVRVPVQPGEGQGQGERHHPQDRAPDHPLAVDSGPAHSGSEREQGSGSMQRLIRPGTMLSSTEFRHCEHAPGYTVTSWAV